MNHGMSELGCRQQPHCLFQRCKEGPDQQRQQSESLDHDARRGRTSNGSSRNPSTTMPGLPGRASRSSTIRSKPSHAPRRRIRGAGTVCLCAGPGGPWPTVRRAAWAPRHGGERRSRVRARAEQLVSECAHGAVEQHGQWNCSLAGHPPRRSRVRAGEGCRDQGSRPAGRGSSGRSGLTPSRRAISGTIISCQCSCFSKCRARSDGVSWSIRR